MMPDMSKHARTSGWNRLRRAIIVAAVILAPVFFAVMFVSVTDLVRPSFHGLAWTVPVATEGCFALLYALDLLLQWAGKPMGWLRLTPYPFAAVSLWLNVASANGDVPGMVGHGAVTAAFFLPVIAFEAAVRKLAVTDLDAAMADARTYAIDLCRSERGRLWRYRVPTLLRRQITSGRLPDEVRSDVALKVEIGRTSGWEAAVRTWVFAELNIDAVARAANARAVADITSSITGAASPRVTETSPEATPGDPSDGMPETPSETPSRDKPRRPSKPRPRVMSDDELMPWVREALEADAEVSVNAFRKVVGTGPDRAKRLLERGRDELRPKPLAAVQ